MSEVIHYFDVAHGVKLFHLQDLRANLQQVWEYDGNLSPIVFLQLYEDPFEWKIAWRTSGIKLHRKLNGFRTEEDWIADSGGQGRPCTAGL